MLERNNKTNMITLQIAVQTLQRVDDAEDVEARSGHLAKWEEDQAPGEAQQNRKRKKGKNFTLSFVFLCRPHLFRNT